MREICGPILFLVSGVESEQPINGLVAAGWADPKAIGQFARAGIKPVELT